VLEEQPRIDPHSTAPDLSLSAGDIQFSHVGFSYRDSEMVLNDFNLHIRGGQTVALVGVSGAGKSTVSKLLFRFYDPTQGVIKIDGTDIREINLPSLRSAIAVVPQDCVLFNDSLRENIRYGRPSATDTDIQQAVKAAHLADFVERLPDGLNTLVGERGLKISGGERQRVAIARAVLKQAHILIFDEATSSLDSHSEQAVLKAFKALAGRQTTLVIAHRLSTIIDADQIIVMHAGNVVEQGTHSALLDASGKYAALWRAQLQEQR
jgi:ATP-binding cassette subfamily B protein